MEKDRLSKEEEILQLADDAAVGYLYEISGKYPQNYMICTRIYRYFLKHWK